MMAKVMSCLLSLKKRILESLESSSIKDVKIYKGMLNANDLVLAEF